jgi:hypothetical protein
MIVLQMLHVLILLEASDVLVTLATQAMENNVVGRFILQFFEDAWYTKKETFRKSYLMNLQH